MPFTGAMFDFLDLHVYDWHWRAFNLTDSAIVIGISLLIFYEFFKKIEHHSLGRKDIGK